jgi:hypothetical protein
MPLHDWTDLGGWEGVHHFWISRLCYWLKPRLPAEYRAYVGAMPGLTVHSGAERPDVGVRHWLPEPTPDPPAAPTLTPSGEMMGVEEPYMVEPEVETATLVVDPDPALFVAARGRVVAAVELISPRNKDHPEARAVYLARYLSYLHAGAHLLLVDVHRRPLGFSFADALSQALQIEQTACPAPQAASYRVGEPAPSGGRFVAIWRNRLTVGAPLPRMPLPLSVHRLIPVDLEHTYQQAAEDAYLN